MALELEMALELVTALETVTVTEMVMELTEALVAVCLLEEGHLN